jgi:hypothetical protein
VTPEELVLQFPSKRLKPFDGMSVTADVWEMAHEYHRQRERLHAMTAHGAGILAGLKIIANDPANSAIYVLPGVALDASGEVIIVPEPMTYDIGNTMSGLLYILLTYGEGQASSDSSDSGGPRFIQAHYSLEVQPTLPATHHVELARIRRQHSHALLTDAKDPAHPHANEIDLRFRRDLMAKPPVAASVAICYAGQGEATARVGVENLARAIAHTANWRVYVDDDVSLAMDLSGYTLVYLVGRGDARLSPDQLNALYQYAQSGGTVFIETCRGAGGKQAHEVEQADEAFSDMLSSFGFQLEALPADHVLLTTPHFFAALPAGYEPQGGRIQLTDNVIFSACDFGSLWQGKQRNGTPTRETLRAAFEWGENLIAYALGRATAPVR